MLVESLSYFQATVHAMAWGLEYCLSLLRTILNFLFQFVCSFTIAS